MTAVDDAAAAVGAALAASTRGVPPVMVGTIQNVVPGQAGTRSGRGVWVTGLETEQSTVMPVRWWTQAFDDRITAGTVTRGARVLIATTSTQPVQLAILDLAVSAPTIPDLNAATPL